MQELLKVFDFKTNDAFIDFFFKGYLCDVSAGQRDSLRKLQREQINSFLIPLILNNFKNFLSIGTLPLFQHKGLLNNDVSLCH